MGDKTVHEQIDAFCIKHAIFPPGSRVILGLSGGPDSLFLLHYLASKQHHGELTVIAAHLDHQWRIDSANDVAFCHEATKKLGVEFAPAKASDLSLKTKFNGSKEELGRLLRRHFFEKVRTDYNANCIALAHHQDDQFETFFIRLLRGATIGGLRGMRPVHNHYVRPLLMSRREEIVAYLNEHSIAYLTDPSNESPLFLRNRIRHTILPALRTVDNRFEHNVQRALHNLADADDCLHSYTCQHLEKITAIYEGNKGLRIAELLALHPYMQKRILITWLCEQGLPFEPSDAWLSEIIRFVRQHENKSHQVHPDWSFIKKEGIVYCKRINKEGTWKTKT